MGDVLVSDGTDPGTRRDHQRVSGGQVSGEGGYDSQTVIAGLGEIVPLPIEARPHRDAPVTRFKSPLPPFEKGELFNYRHLRNGPR